MKASDKDIETILKQNRKLRNDNSRLASEFKRLISQFEKFHLQLKAANTKARKQKKNPN